MRLEEQNASPAAARAAAEAANLLATFDFSGSRSHSGVEGVSLDQQTKFARDFRQQLETIVVRLAAYKDRDGNAWLSPDHLRPARHTCGRYRPRSDFHVFVSEAYPISRALVPAWLGQRGRMEFPAHRVVAGEAAIAHELIHVLLPNGNRMLAEGLASYLQYKVFPKTLVFPNFGRSFEEMVGTFLRTRFPADPAGALWQMDLDALEKIPTPDRMSLRIGADLVGSKSIDQAPKPKEEKAIYAVVGSLIEFLIENPIGDDLLTEANFGALYKCTPLRPLERDCGDADRWRRCYQGDGLSYSFTKLALLWKTYMHFLLFRRPSSGAGDAAPIPRRFAQIPPVEKLYQKLRAMVGLRPKPGAGAKKNAKIEPGRSGADRQHRRRALQRRSARRAREVS
jgi:hypothetical protein